VADLPAISAVIANRDGADLLPRILPPLLEELPPDRHEILVIDDASEDGSVALVHRDFPAVRVIALPGNVGFGEACNRGFQEARHDVVLLLNSDMEVTPGSVEVLAEHFADAEVFAAGPEFTEPGEETGLVDDGRGTVRPTIGAPAGGGLFSRGKFVELGGFDRLYHPFYWEDVDLGWNAWRRGWRIVRDARACFVHLGSATINRLYSRQYVARVRARNRYLFGWKNFQTPRLRQRHLAVMMRRILADLVRRGDAASLLALFDAWRLRARVKPTAMEARRTEEQVVADARLDVERLLRV